VELSDADECRSGVLVQALQRGESPFRLRTPDGWLCEKPPLYYLLAAWASFGRDVDEVPLRIVSAAAAWGTLWAAAVLARAAGGPAAAWAALALLSANPIFARWMRQAMVDMTLTFFVTLSALAAVAGRTGRWGPWKAAGLWGLSTGLAVLTKGPVGLALAVAPVVGSWIVDRKGRVGPSLAPAGAALALALAVALAWYGPAWAAGGREFLETSVLGENLYMPLGRPQGIGVSHRKSLFYYPAVQAGALLSALPLAGAILRARWRDLVAEPAVRMLGMGFLLGFGLFEAAANKRTHYLLPLQPMAVAVLAAAAGRGIQETPLGRAARAALTATLAVFCLAAVAGLGAAWKSREGLPPLSGHGGMLLGFGLAAAGLGGVLIAAWRRSGRPPELEGAMLLALFAAAVGGLLKSSFEADRNRTRAFVARARAIVGPAERPLLVGPIHGYALDFYWPDGIRRGAGSEPPPRWALVRRTHPWASDPAWRVRAVWPGCDPDRDVLLLEGPEATKSP
jgi:4-amino-4-deoxy-L-arabinose transferase-like glycosyltransferase